MAEGTLVRLGSERARERAWAWERDLEERGRSWVGFCGERTPPAVWGFREGERGPPVVEAEGRVEEGAWFSAFLFHPTPSCFAGDSMMSMNSAEISPRTACWFPMLCVVCCVVFCCLLLSGQVRSVGDVSVFSVFCCFRLGKTKDRWGKW